MIEYFKVLYIKDLKIFAKKKKSTFDYSRFYSNHCFAFFLHKQILKKRNLF